MNTALRFLICDLYSSRFTEARLKMIVARVLMFAAAVFLCTGCNLMGVAADAVVGAGSTEAVCLMSKRPTVVIAEKFSNPAETGMSDESLARFIADELTAHDVAPQVDPDKVFTMRDADRARWQTLTIAGVGRAVGAEQILYVSINKLSVDRSASADGLKGRGDVHVRLVESSTGATIWPTNSALGYPVSAETRMFSQEDGSISEASVRNELLRALAVRTGQLFYTVSND